MRRAAAVQQTRFTLNLVGADRLVGGLAADAELTAQLGHALLSQCVTLDQAQSFRFSTRMSPGQHMCLLVVWFPQSHDVSPMCPL